jgi:hypothetical protein
MKKILFVFILFPVLVFGQTRNKSFLVLSGGMNFRTSEVLIYNNKNGFTADISFERTAGSSLAWGIGLEISGFPGSSEIKDTRSRGTLGGMIKVQDNSVMADELQPFVKGGAGFSIVGKRGGHQNFPGGGFTYFAGAGLNYMTDKHVKLFLESGYRTTPFYQESYSNIYLNLGISLDLR